ncbi:MAG: AbrB/MazE/SpoVT family DNA-binding domain-containing protein [Bacteroidota bacterium]|nr:AbrB/MazE/SpoVT family DNA-binding domain-containing protein [Bacteroidota bacterium]
MTTKIQKWGNSLALRIPKSFAETTQIKEGSEIKLSLEKNKIIITKKEKSKFTLKELLLRINEDNIHNEISFGSHGGKELL